MTFNDVVADWMRSENYSVAQVTKVEGRGTDWQGSTESGFYETFAVEIQYVAGWRTATYLDVSGEEMGRLWKYVVNEGWPTESGDTSPGSE